MSSLFDVLPELRARVPWVALADLPTPVESGARLVQALGASGELWLKRDDLSSAIYGGNKLRMLEHLLPEAQQSGTQRVYATGAMGSSFSLATALHAPRLGLKAGVIAFPQPMTPESERSHQALAGRARLIEIPHWSLLPLASERARRRGEQEAERVCVFSQVRMSPVAMLGYVAAGLELAMQIAGGECPEPTSLVLPIGSAATTAGVLAGIGLACQLGIGFRHMPWVQAVRIAAWPLSRRSRVQSLAAGVLAHLASLQQKPRFRAQDVDLTRLRIVADQLGAGYPHPTPASVQARLLFSREGWPILDETYSGKAAAHLVNMLQSANAEGPTLFWCTKSSAPLPDRLPA